MKPIWFKQKIISNKDSVFVKNILSELSLNTVCEEARCPNRGHCYSCGHATFLLMGPSCSRNCKFCAVDPSVPPPLDSSEPIRVATAVKRLKLSYVVLTSVTRDDLTDGGAEHIALTVENIHKSSPMCKVEILVPDFQGNTNSIKRVLMSNPAVFNHNIEAVPRLFPVVRPMANFEQSLIILKNASELSDIPIKSGFMVGFGESEAEVYELLDKLYDNGVTMATIGQYLAPSSRHFPIFEYVHPDIFKKYEDYAFKIGFKGVQSGPLVRSSYRADEMYNSLTKK